MDCVMPAALRNKVNAGFPPRGQIGWNGQSLLARELHKAAGKIDIVMVERSLQFAAQPRGVGD